MKKVLCSWIAWTTTNELSCKIHKSIVEVHVSNALSLPLGQSIMSLTEYTEHIEHRNSNLRVSIELALERVHNLVGG